MLTIEDLILISTLLLLTGLTYYIFVLRRKKPKITSFTQLKNHKNHLPKIQQVEEKKEQQLSKKELQKQKIK